MRWILQVMLLLALLAVVAANHDEWPAAITAARAARPGYLTGAAVTGVAWLLAYGAVYWLVLRGAGVRLPCRRALLVAWAARLANVVIKSGGMAGLAVVVAEVRRSGGPATRASLGYLLVLAVEDVVFLVLLGFALLVLWLQGQVGRLELGAAALTYLTLGTLLIAGMWLIRSTERVARVYGVLAGVVNGAARRVGRGPVLDPTAGGRVGADAREVATLVARRRARLLPGLAATALRELLAIATLWLVLRAFDADASPLLALTAYALTVLFSYVWIVPSGLGLVEVSLTALLARSGMTVATAGLATVTYRILQFWLPLLVGVAATRAIHIGSDSRRGARPAEQTGADDEAGTALR